MLKLDSAFLIVFKHYYFNPAMKWYFSYLLELHFWMKAPPSWSWSHGSWIYNYLCNQCLSPLNLWVRTPLRRGVLNKHYVIKFVSDLRQVGSFFRVLRFPPPINWPPWYNWTTCMLKLALNTIHSPNWMKTLNKEYN